MSLSYKENFIIASKGALMGIANIMPGVSGSTIAYISGIYEELIQSLKSLNPNNLKSIFKSGIRNFWITINGTFLVVLLLGMLIGIFLLAKIISFLLVEFPIPVWSFFFGLILASAIYLTNKSKLWEFKNILSVLTGIGIAYFVTIISPVANSKDPEYWYVVLSGAISICALIMPRISGSVILLLMGQYLFIITAVVNLRITYLCMFGLGSLIGIISFSNALSWLLQKYYTRTVGFLAGVMIGSLNKIWPWKHTLLSHTNQFAQIIPDKQENVFPFLYFELTGKDPQLLYAILMIITGILVIFLIESAYSKAKIAKDIKR